MSKKRCHQIPVQSPPTVINVQPSWLNLILVLTMREQIALGCLQGILSCPADYRWAQNTEERVTKAFEYASEFIRQS